MVHQINQKIVTLSEYGLKNFKNELLRLKNENNIYDKTNHDWFDMLPKKIENYLEWFFLFDNDEPVAFSTIQKYYSGCYRVLTRTYIYRKYRRFTNPKHDNINNPTISMRLLPSQLSYIGKYKTIFVSMQDLKKRNSLKIFKQRIENFTNAQWELSPNMVLTCDKDWGKTCWQNVIYNGLKPALDSITIDEWKNRYD